MKYPKLVPEWACKTPIIVRLTSDEIGEYGESEEILSLDTKCNYQSTSKRVYTDKETYIELKGVALFNGDIIPETFNASSGECEVYGEKYQIYNISKARNIDGTVNYTKIELM